MKLNRWGLCVSQEKLSLASELETQKEDRRMKPRVVTAQLCMSMLGRSRELELAHLGKWLLTHQLEDLEHHLVYLGEEGELHKWCLACSRAGCTRSSPTPVCPSSAPVDTRAHTAAALFSFYFS